MNPLRTLLLWIKQVFAKMISRHELMQYFFHKETEESSLSPKNDEPTSNISPPSDENNDNQVEESSLNPKNKVMMPNSSPTDK